MGYIGLAPLTVCRTTSGSFVQIYANAPAPDDIDPDDAARLVEEKYLAKGDDPEPNRAKAPSVDEILAGVGDDKDKASAALEEENAAAKPRKTLVEKLGAIVNAEPAT